MSIHFAARFKRVSLLCCLLSFALACSPVDRLGSYLETAGKLLDDYGSVSVSSPLFADSHVVNDGGFEFGLNRTAQQYYDDARKDVQGAVSTFLEHARETNVGLRVRANLQDMLTNSMLYDGYQADLDAFKRKNAMLESASLMQLIIPMVDPSLGQNEAAIKAAAELATTNAAPPDPKIESFNRLQKMIEALTATGNTLPGPTERPAPPTFQNNPPEFDETVIPTTDKVKEVLANQKFETFLNLLGVVKPSTVPVIPNSTAINTAAGAKTIENIFNFLGKPELARQFQDKIVLIGVSMVSVTPGTKTETGYMADVSVSVSYDYQPVRNDLWRALKEASSRDGSLKRQIETIDQQWIDLNREQAPPPFGATNVSPEHVVPSYLAGGPSGLYQIDVAGSTQRMQSVVPPAPLVAAVSPMTDIQTLDMASSIRTQDAIAMKIALVVSGFGAEAQAAGVLQDIERFQQDVITRTAFNTVAGYSNSGGVFGYQVGPSLVGVTNVAKGKQHRATGPGMVLQRQSFPALIFVGIDRDDLKLKFQYDVNSNPKWRIVEPRIQFRQTTRWIPIRKSLNDPIFEIRPRVSENRRLYVADQLRKAANLLETSNPDSVFSNASGTQADVAFEDYARNRISILRSHVIEAFHFQAVPISAFLTRKQLPTTQPAVEN